jgi:pyruvate/2-oxoglutarate dehydrogenase complex dihydrolipoamide acyltransferase (E2) component
LLLDLRLPTTQKKNAWFAIVCRTKRLIDAQNPTLRVTSNCRCSASTPGQLHPKRPESHSTSSLLSNVTKCLMLPSCPSTAGKMVDELNDHDAPANGAESSRNSLHGTATEEPNERLNASHSFSSGQSTSSSASSFEPALALNAGGDKVLTTPAVRRMATEHHINLQEVQATGKDGRVLKEDVIRHLEQIKTPPASSSKSPANSNQTKDNQLQPTGATNRAVRPVATSAATTTLSSGSSKDTSSGTSGKLAQLEEDQVHRLKGVQKAMAKSMTAALRIPHFGLSDELNLTKLVKLRAQLKKQAERRGVHLSYLPFFLKAASLALRQYPVLNSTFDADQEQLTYRAAHNIGVAVDSPSGLVVPNVKNVQNLTILEIAQQLNHLQSLASSNQLSNNELTGGTFTLSNIGSVSQLFGLTLTSSID